MAKHGDKLVYQQAYTDLFGLIMVGKTNSPEAIGLRQRMDNMPGSNNDKIDWGMQVGCQLYCKVVGK